MADQQDVDLTVEPVAGEVTPPDVDLTDEAVGGGVAPPVTITYDERPEREQARGVLALGLLGLLILTVVGVLFFIAFDKLDGTALTESVLPAVVALAGTALGFYFGQNTTTRDEDRGSGVVNVGSSTPPTTGPPATTTTGPPVTTTTRPPATTTTRPPVTTTTGPPVTTTTEPPGP
jgi:hypothetical protein